MLSSRRPKVPGSVRRVSCQVMCIIACVKRKIMCVATSCGVWYRILMYPTSATAVASITT